MTESHKWSRNRCQGLRRHGTGSYRTLIMSLSWPSCVCLEILATICRQRWVRQNSIFESRFHHKICITVTPEVEDKDIQCFVPNFQYNSPANMQISMIIISMRTILLVNTFKYIFLIIRLLLPSSTSVSTSLSKEGSQ